jgi:zinc transport system substrate-binding protein
MILTSIHRRRGLPAMAIVAVLVVTSSCRAGASQAGDRTSVVASFYPLYEAARRIGGERVAVTNLTPAGVEPHDLELSPTQVDQILDATIVLYLGMGFQPAVEEAVRQRGQAPSVDLLDGLLPRLPTLRGDGGQVDPHVWLDPAVMGEIVDRVADELARIDPAGLDTYRTKAASYRAKIGALHRRYREGLANCARGVIVTSHAAFRYLAARYGLRQESIAGLSPEAEPDPNRLAELADLVSREGVTTIFTEELVSPRVADTLAREVGVSTAVLDPLEGLTEPEVDRGEDYESVMDRNLEALRTALGCT